ncbi:hypothetical protein [Nocardia sp. NBC_00416]|uniref:hypothetical protein n=1 Tax=Nocardia sp. NBC_00416 TaxID=2975991 RepID=UPI002E1F585A
MPTLETHTRQDSGFLVATTESGVSVVLPDRDGPVRRAVPIGEEAERTSARLRAVREQGSHDSVAWRI